MINLSKKDIEKFELIGQGGFGQIYRKDDKVYKIYREKIKTMMGSVVKNPSLKYNSIKLNRLINLNNKLKKNNLIENLIFINGKFQGVVMPYYEGILLSRTMEKPLEEKIEIAYQIVEKAKELTQNFIYPLDYKLNNIILENNEVKILDLDDYYTKVDLFVNPIHKRKCIRGLDETIKTYFHEFKTFQLPKEISPNLTKQIEPICSEYKDIEKYIYKKSKKENYIIIKNIADIYENIDFLRNSNYKKIYVYNRENIEETFNTFSKLGIDLYDVVSIYEIEKYMNSFLCDDCLGIKDGKILKLKK